MSLIVFKSPGIFVIFIFKAWEVLKIVQVLEGP